MPPRCATTTSSSSRTWDSPRPRNGVVRHWKKVSPQGAGKTIAEVERQAIVRALEATRWNRTAAAKALNISFRALRYRMEKLGLDAGDGDGDAGSE